MDNARFQALYELAEEGNLEAQADLWAEFQFIYGSDDPSKFEQAGGGEKC